MSEPLRVCINAVLGNTASGVTTLVLGLACGLSQLEGPEEFHFLVAGDNEWLKPYVAGNCRLLPTAAPRQSAAKAVARRVPGLKRMWDSLPEPLLRATARPLLPPVNPPGQRPFDVVHFPTQGGFASSLPSIYHPHDLQHLHFPDLFTRRARFERERQYRFYCQQAAVVAVASHWTKRDLMRWYYIAEEKIAVVPMAPILEHYAKPNHGDIAQVLRARGLPAEFVFYPACSWPHKNHVNLLRALAILRDRHHLTVAFVSAGVQTDFFPVIRQEVKALDLGSQVWFLGPVSQLELQCLYGRARVVAIPTRFEAASFPLWEAFQAGVPACCSRVTSLPEQAKDAALLFDPEQPEQIADAILRLWTNRRLAGELAERGRRRLATLSWARTARIFRAHYRRLGGRRLTAEDRELLAAPPPF